MQKPLQPPPAPEQWESPESIAAYAQQCLSALNLPNWSFCYDRATRRLGCCRPASSNISLSRHLVAHYISREPAHNGIIWRTLLHEIAHALNWEHHRGHRHDRGWQQYCAALGIPGMRASVSCDDFAPVPKRERKPLYALVIKDSGELIRHYYSRPRRTAAKLRHCYIPGRKAETLGKLTIIALDEQQTDAP